MDEKAKKILFQTYWSKNGWKDEYTITPEDFAYAKEKGLMFDTITISHDDCIKQIIEIVSSISIEQVVKAFLSSLSTRRLDWRSGIASYYIAKLLTPHQYVPIEVGCSCIDNGRIAVANTCGVCKNVKYGVIGNEKYIDVDLNVLNFERIKWGGVRHGELIYTLFDLEQFKKEQIIDPSKIDIEIFKTILSSIKACKTGDFPSVLCDKLKAIPNLKSNKDERTVIIEILACIGILRPLSYDRAVNGKNDWTYIEYWRGEDGYDEKIVEQYFGKYL